MYGEFSGCRGPRMQPIRRLSTTVPKIVPSVTCDITCFVHGLVGHQPPVPTIMTSPLFRPGGRCAMSCSERGCQFCLDAEIGGTGSPGRCDKPLHPLVFGVQFRIVLYRNDAHHAPIWDNHLQQAVAP